MSPSCSGQLRLIVDDSRVVRQIAQRTLQEAGLRVVEAAEGPESLDACRSCRPDYVLSDWNMPRMNGIERPEAVHDKFGIELPRVSSCTTENESDRIVTTSEAGVQELIMRPFDADILIGKMNDVAMPPGGRT